MIVDDIRVLVDDIRMSADMTLMLIDIERGGHVWSPSVSLGISMSYSN